MDFFSKRQRHVLYLLCHRESFLDLFSYIISMISLINCRTFVSLQIISYFIVSLNIVLTMQMIFQKCFDNLDKKLRHWFQCKQVLHITYDSHNLSYLILSCILSSKILGLCQRNLKHFPQRLKKLAYSQLVRSTFDNCASI